MLPAELDAAAPAAAAGPAWITIRFAVNESGRAQDVEVLESSPPAADKHIARLRKRLLGTAFHVRDFGHVAFYDESAGRIEMHLEALRALDVSIDGVPRRFAKGERIHTENSYKYRPEAFDRLLADAGFAQRRAFLDPAGDFAVFHAR